MAKDKTYMPQSTAGLIRYFEEAEDAIKLKPEHVAVITGGVVVLEILAKLFLG